MKCNYARSFIILCLTVTNAIRAEIIEPFSEREIALENIEAERVSAAEERMHAAQIAAEMQKKMVAERAAFFSAEEAALEKEERASNISVETKHKEKISLQDLEAAAKDPELELEPISDEEITLEQVLQKSIPSTVTNVADIEALLVNHIYGEMKTLDMPVDFVEKFKALYADKEDFFSFLENAEWREDETYASLTEEQKSRFDEFIAACKDVYSEADINAQDVSKMQSILNALKGEIISIIGPTDKLPDLILDKVMNAFVNKINDILVDKCRQRVVLKPFSNKPDVK